MRWTQLSKADLNLLSVFAVFAEAHSVSKAAERLSLSQPAVSRALQRLRRMFGDDDLFIRTRVGYKLTAHGKKIQTELDVILPKLDLLLRRRVFDPCVETVSFKIVTTDYAFSLMGEGLSSLVVTRENKISLQFLSWMEGIYEKSEQGRIDLIFQVNEGSPPPHFQTEVLFEDELVCVVSKQSLFKKRRLSLKQYAAAEHIVVGLGGPLQTMPDKMLAKLGVERKCRIQVPYFAAGIDAVATSELIATIPLRFAARFCDPTKLRLISPPKEFSKFEYLMAWHPRQQKDASHQWLREQVRSVVKNVTPGVFLSPNLTRS